MNFLFALIDKGRWIGRGEGKVEAQSIRAALGQHCNCEGLAFSLLHLRATMTFRQSSLENYLYLTSGVRLGVNQARLCEMDHIGVDLVHGLRLPTLQRYAKEHLQEAGTGTSHFSKTEGRTTINCGRMHSKTVMEMAITAVPLGTMYCT